MPRRKAPEVVDPDAEPVAPEPLVPGVARAITPLIRRIVAPNPGMMTGPGTNTYLVGIDEIAVIDPGPDDDAHLDAIAGCGGDLIRWILCTHTHPDHSPGAAGLKARTGAEVLAWDSRDGLTVDRKFRHGDQVEATEFRLTGVHTPGHASNHLCYLMEEEHVLFSGDHIMQGSTVVIRPPDGNMARYLDSLAQVRAIRRLRAIAPGHGRLIEDPKEAIDAYVEHRLAREQQILDLVTAAGSTRIDDLVEVIYADIKPELHPVARFTVHAHLLKLAKEGRVKGRSIDGRWSVA
jgi:glyoxylase-like metal-dependent hydrolase (beta-lactamase superfamily II)